MSGDASQEIKARSFPTQDRKSGDGIWGIADRASLRSRVESASPRAYQVVELHEDAMLRALANVPMEFTKAAKRVKVVVSLPMPEGNFARFRIEESPVMEPELAAQFPEVKSYRGQGVDDPTATARFDWSPEGFHAIVLSANGTVFISRYSADDERNYITFHKEDLQDGFQPPQCEVTEEMQASSELRRQFAAEGFAPNAFVGTTLRTYRLALATTVEYTNNPTYGGNKSSTLTKLNTIVNLINAIYEREVSIRFQLVSSELSIIFDTEPDGYTNSSVGTMLNENPTVLNATIGSGAYDIGHVFGLSSAGSSSGVAQIAVVCGANKGRGASVLGIAPVTGNFSIDSGLVSHEWGHQFSAVHAFNSTSNICGSAGQRSASTAFEPGSGSTLMAYPGTCSPENLQSSSDNYFHGGSFDQIASYSAGSGNSCAAATATGNNPPTVSAGLDYTVPMGTPFTLTATGSDPDSDSLTYSWEELDTGAASPPMTDDGTRPLFRSFPAVTSPSRTFPKLSNILNNTSTIGETLPVTTRNMNFRVTARDNRATGGGVNSDAMILHVTAASGPYVVTQPNTAVTWAGGTSQTVTWNVANTSTPPVNCANVKITLSTDGGNTFPFVLAASTPNDGAETVVIPNTSATTARIKVEAVGNIFFDTSNTNFTITITQGAVAGFHDGAGCNTIQGWAWDQNSPNSTVNVDIYDGNTLIGTTPANMYREDLLNALGSPNHGFSFLTPAALKNGAAHSIVVKFSGTSTLLSNTTKTLQCTLAPNLIGRHDGQGCNAIEGWAWDSNDSTGTVNVDIYDGATLIGSTAATLYRQDLADVFGSPFHGFIFRPPASFRDGQPHTITVKYGGTNTNLPDSPRTSACTSNTPNFQGNLDVADCNTISGYAWDANDDNTINVAIYVDGGFLVVVPAQQLYPGIGNGFHGFKFAVPLSFKNGQPHSILVRFSGTTTSLSGTPKTINCSGP